MRRYLGMICSFVVFAGLILIWCLLTLPSLEPYPAAVIVGTVVVLELGIIAASATSAVIDRLLIKRRTRETTSSVRFALHTTPPMIVGVVFEQGPYCDDLSWV